MSAKFPEYKKFDLSQIDNEILDKWESENIFQLSLDTRRSNKPFVFYEGPPSANGMPGIHHVISRTIKDIICRYKTLKGFLVERKAGWDTHGLPVELGVEKKLGITKEDIGSKISVKEYNDECKKDVMKYTREWEDLTRKMGYWVDMEHPYITYDNRYIETLWYLLAELYKKGLLYKGYTIQPYSPAAGTGLSSHELNQPGCYRDVKDTTCVAQFKIIRDPKSEFLFEGVSADLYILAWTTTPWTLPSNTALAMGADIDYVRVKTYNHYTRQKITVILAKALVNNFFTEKNRASVELEYLEGMTDIAPVVVESFNRDNSSFKGARFEGIHYEQLIHWIKPNGRAFEVLIGDFVTTEEGTGIVHIAPTFGADDYRVAKQNDVAAVLVRDNSGSLAPLVDKKGRFFPLENLDAEFIANNVYSEAYKEFAGRFVKNEYDDSLTEKDSTVDIDISVMLKKENKAFRIEKYVHNYPHCWRTDKPILYYPLDSWFIRTTEYKEKLIALNNTINWKPDSTGTGRFGKWLENLVDWNLSRSRFWGTPLPIWISEDKKEEKCIGSVHELKIEIDKSVASGFMKSNPLNSFKKEDFSDKNYGNFDLHRPFVDEIILVSDSGQKMLREPDLIDVWFDSGAMPYAQVHYPFATKDEAFNKVFPADFIAEGVDQTRGWFFTLHAISSMLFNSVAFKNIISNGLVLDKNGNKMSKRLGNAADPFEIISKYGADPLRWYLITNAQPWDNLKFDVDGIDESRRKFFSTLHNTYSFFALYANVDGFKGSEAEVPVENRPEADRWILSLLNSLIKEVGEHYENYEPTKAGRAIQDFAIENLSNWYVRLNRKRFWGGGFTKDKLAAYQTLYSCLETIAVLSSPIAPFYSDKIFCDLNTISGKSPLKSVHLVEFPKFNSSNINKELEERMAIAQRISSMILGLRRKVNIKVRQPLGKIMVPITDTKFEEQIQEVASLIKSEVNVKQIEYLRDSEGILVKKIKPNFKTLGPRYGKLMKQISEAVSNLTQKDIAVIETTGTYSFELSGEKISIGPEDVEIFSEDIPGWLVANEGRLTVALDITITNELRQEGIAREFINRIQNLRKESGYEVTDKINIRILSNSAIDDAVHNFRDYIGSQTLSDSIELVTKLQAEEATEVSLDDTIKTLIQINKI
jgi:isoleucyl-tRNA synthetase